MALDISDALIPRFSKIAIFFPYAPLLLFPKREEELKNIILSHSHSSSKLLLQDRMDDLCLLIGTEAFSISLQLGSHLMAGQRADGLTLL